MSRKKRRAVLGIRAQISPSTMKHCFMLGLGNVLERAEWTLRRDRHQGFVRQAGSEPGAFQTPIMQQDSAGQKEQECFRQSCSLGFYASIVY
ncbi:hypothetical protein EYF80_008925 [Liparis tanakae]|uniref:Uncharacterized protein n=1 Tax=Liparis tanakae TaxID=230148 RepID=A0A4Z2ISE9_9TELE|nr:hypothetical protein EYF80_008925 [Liparis tanakae]